MRWYLNDSSLQGQFATERAFVDEIAELAKLKMQLPVSGSQLYCTNKLSLTEVTRGASCNEAIVRAARVDERRLILSWIAKSGPFLEDDRMPEEEDYFEFEGLDVTDHGLGEAARREKNGDDSGVFSFTGGKINFEKTPLVVQHGIPGDILGHLDISNVWAVPQLEGRIREISAEPQNWRELLQVCRSRFELLIIPDSIQERIERETFYPVVARRTLALLETLQRIVSGRSAEGSLDEKALSLWNQHSQGDKAWFTDESDGNKRKFKNEMTFPDPENPANRLFCPWHGKIKTPQFRIHFEWPVPPGQSRLKILYIGPKITKS